MELGDKERKLLLMCLQQNWKGVQDTMLSLLALLDQPDFQQTVLTGPLMQV